ncbi:MAG: STAS domain-containing protein [Actinomycetota bacterium]|nr:STAS domain-containing protein [Actinomycetota bacterium]
MSNEATDPALLEIEPIQDGLRIRGEVDLSNIERFSQQVRGAARPGHLLVLDLSECDYLGSEAIGVLIETWKKVRDGGRLVLRSPGPTMRRVLELAGLGKFPDVDIPGDG